MELAGLKVVLDGDVTKLEAALARGTEYLKSYAKYAQDMFKGIKIDVGNIQGATQAQKDAADAAYKLAQAKLAEARADKIRFDMANKTESQKKREKDLYDELVAQNNAIVREYYNASAAVAKYGEASGISAAKLEEMRQAAIKGQQQLRDIEQGAGRFQRNVGNYASAFNPLQNAITQLLREMPAGVNSIQTMLLGMSNNWGALQDSIRQIIIQNNALRAQGQPTVSLGKQLAASFFSWNTALSVGITLLTVYGKDIVEWIRGTKQAEEAQKRLNEEKKRSEDIDRQANRQAGEQIGIIKSKLSVIESEVASEKQRKEALKSLQDEYPSYLRNLDLDDAKNGKLAATINNQLVPAIIAAAKARALQNKIADNAAKELDLIEAQDRALKSYNKSQKDIATQNQKLAQQGRSSTFSNNRGFGINVGTNYEGESQAINASKAAADELTSINQQRQELQKSNSFLLGEIAKNSNKLGNLDFSGADIAKGGSAAKSGNRQETPLEKLAKDLQQIDVEKSRNIITALDALNQQMSAYEEFLKNTATGKNALPNDNAFVQTAMSNIDRLKTAIAQAELEVRPKIAPISEKEVSDLDESIQAAAKTVTITVKPVLDRVSVNQAKVEADNLGKEIGDKLKDQMAQVGVDIGVAMGEGLGDILSGDGTLADGLKRIGNALTKMLESIGKMLIESGIRTLAARKAAEGISMNPAVAIGVGVATVAASRALQNNINNASKGVRFADGGIVYGRTQALVGEYSNARSNPEVIAPLDKLSAKLREVGFNTQTQEVVRERYEITGEQLALVLERYKRNKV